MFERFTTETRHAVHLALSEAKVLGADRIGAEHLLLGVAHARSGAAAEALRAAGVDAARLRTQAVANPEAAPLDADSLAALGIDLDQVRRAAEAAFGPGVLDRPARRQTGRTRARMTPAAKAAIGRGLQVAQARQDGALTAGHLLVGIIEQADKEALKLLTAAKVDPGALREDVLRRMTAAA